MSADNWAVCPACKAKEEARIAALQQQAAEAYGVMPLEGFDELRAQAAVPIDIFSITTFREDYEFFGAESGTVTASYSGTCTVCKLSLSFSEQHPFWPTP